MNIRMKLMYLLVAAALYSFVSQADDEITAGYMLSVEKGILSFSVASAGLKYDMTGEALDRKVNVVTTKQTLAISADITDPGIIFIKNTSTNGTVLLLGVDADAAFIKINAGHGWMGNLATNVVSIKPEGTATGTVESIILSR